MWPVCGPLAVPLGAAINSPAVYLLFSTGAGDGNRTRMTSLEGWSSTIELRPQRPRPGAAVTRQAYRLRRHPGDPPQPRGARNGKIGGNR